MNARTCCLSLLLVAIALPAAAQDLSDDFERALSELGKLSPGVVQRAKLTTIDSQAMAAVFQLLIAQPPAELNEATIRQWAKDHNIDELDLAVAVLDWLALERFSTVEYRPFAALLWEHVQESEQIIATLPAQARVFLAMYLATTGGEDAIDRQIVEQELIPVVAEELKRVFTTGAQKNWPRILAALIWGYQYVDDHATAVKVSEDWLRWAEYWKIPTDERHLSSAEEMLDDSIMAVYGVGEFVNRLVQTIHEPGPKSEKAKKAQQRFLALARANPEAREIMAGEFKRVWPEKVTVSLRAGEQVTRTLTVKGDDLFWVRGADCELPWVNAVLEKETVGRRDNSYTMDLTIGPIENAGTYQTTVVIQTNDPRNHTIRLPVSVEVLSPVTARPDSFFFGFLKTGQDKSATVTLTSTVPFEVTAAQADKPELITVEVTKQEDNSYQIKATLKTPDQPGTLEGNIEVQTDLPGQETVTIPYFVQISAAE